MRTALAKAAGSVVPIKSGLLLGRVMSSPFGVAAILETVATAGLAECGWPYLGDKHVAARPP